jgi:flagellar hook-associated protein 1 FlgK
MASSLGIGISGLLAAQNSLTTTSHNISNVNTEGYSRQRVEQGTRIPEYFGGNYIGSGVQVDAVARMYDSFLGNLVRTYISQESQQSTFMSYSKQVDDILGSQELSLSSGLNSFFESVNEVANDPTSIAARQVLLSEAGLLANRFNTLDSQLTRIDQSIDNDLTVAVSEINNLSAGIAELNQAIIAARGSTGAEPNDLLDKRDNLINQLSELVSVSTIEESNGAINIFVGSGQGLVTGTSSFDLSTISDTSTSPPRVAIAYGANQQDISAQLTGGAIGAAFSVRNDIIDATRTELDLLAASVVSGFNAVHNNTTNIANGGQGSVDLDGNDGGDLFDPANVTAATISVLITDPRAIAASSKFDAATGTVNISGPGNNENALALANIQSDNSLVVVSAGPPAVTLSLGDQYATMVSSVATKTRQAEASQQTQATLLSQTQQRYDSVSGVNLDEEAANLIKYQQAYQAASQVIVVSNTIFETLISSV